MKTRAATMGAFVCLLALGAIGCDAQRDTLTSALENDNVESDAPLTSHKFFTGRDSFGVALKIRLAGDVALVDDGRCPEMTVVLAGSGNATHLGGIEGESSHCADEADLSSFSDGTFVLTGSTGGTIIGNYPPLPVVTAVGKHGSDDVGDVIETKAEISGGEISAVQRDEVEGRGDLRIVMQPDGGFTLTFDGWLLHHLADD